MDINRDANPCIICSPDHPHGIHARFSSRDGMAVTEVTLGDSWQGFTGMVQGGIITGLLDDAMWYAIYGAHQVTTVTAEITVRFIRPVLIGRPISVTGRVVRHRRRLQDTSGEITQGGILCAVATGRFMPKQEAEPL